MKNLNLLTTLEVVVKKLTLGSFSQSSFWRYMPYHLLQNLGKQFKTETYEMNQRQWILLKKRRREEDLTIVYEGELKCQQCLCIQTFSFRRSVTKDARKVVSYCRNLIVSNRGDLWNVRWFWLALIHESQF